MRNLAWQYMAMLPLSLRPHAIMQSQLVLVSMLQRCSSRNGMAVEKLTGHACGVLLPMSLWTLCMSAVINLAHLCDPALICISLAVGWLFII